MSLEKPFFNTNFSFYTCHTISCFLFLKLYCEHVECGDQHEVFVLDYLNIRNTTKTYF
jgi:hypothetical protein